MSFFLPLLLISSFRPLSLTPHKTPVVFFRQGAREVLTSALTKAVEDERLGAGFVGVCVAEEETGKVLFERNADRVFMPASNNKLLTAFAIMESSPERVFRTRIARYGTLQPDGNLTGCLVVIGDGDPSLTPERDCADW